jgi:hypothetical protein
MSARRSLTLIGSAKLCRRSLNAKVLEKDGERKRGMEADRNERLRVSCSHGNIRRTPSPELPPSECAMCSISRVTRCTNLSIRGLEVKIFVHDINLGLQRVQSQLHIT